MPLCIQVPPDKGRAIPPQPRHPARQRDHSALLRGARRPGKKQPHVPVEPSGGGHHRHGGTLPQGGGHHGDTSGWGGLPLSHQADDEGGTHGWLFRLAPGLRVRPRTPDLPPSSSKFIVTNLSDTGITMDASTLTWEQFSLQSTSVTRKMAA